MSDITRTILVTGARSGIGQATTTKMLQAGHHVIGVARDCSQLGSEENFTPVELDFAKPDLLTARLPALRNTLKKVDTVVFCAGYGQFASLEEFSFNQILALITVNFTSQVLLTRFLLPFLKQKPHSDLIFIGSEAALKGSRKGSVYCASKFALRGFAQALREECASSRLRVTLINPGMVKTPFFDPLDFEPGPHADNFISATDIAATVQFVINTPASVVIDEINLSPLKKVVRFKN